MLLPLPAAYVRDVVELAARWKVDAGALLEGLPVTAEALSRPDTRVPLAVCVEIVRRAHALTGEPALAIHLGTQMRASSHGFLGFAAMTAGTLGEAIELTARFASTRTTALELSLHVEGETAALVLDERAELGELRQFTVLSLLVGLWQLGESLTGRSLEGWAELAFPQPAYLQGSALASERMRFGRAVSRLAFPATSLELPLRHADALATQLARQECERELAAVADAGLPARVRAEIARAGGASGLPEVARALHMSPRTLKRKLAGRGTSFSAVRDQLRRQRALLLLDDRALSIGEVAARLGYTELPNFSRAFRRWTGVSPAAHRARQRPPGRSG